MNKSKIYLIFFFVLLILLLPGCSYKIVKENNITDDNFNKKQECAKYKNDIEKKFTDEAGISLNILDEIFYSPSLNSCLCSYTTFYFDANGKPMDKMGPSYVIQDILSNETILSGDSATNNDIVKLYYQRKNELKK